MLPPDVQGSPAGPSLPVLLQSLGARADMQQRSAIRSVLALPHRWTPESVAEVIANVLARSAEQQISLRADIIALLAPPAAPPPDYPSPSDPAAPDPEGRAPARYRAAALGSALRAATRATPRRTLWLALLTAILAALTIVVAVYGEVLAALLPANLLPITAEELRRKLLWGCGALAAAPLLGYAIERGFGAIGLLLGERRRPLAQFTGRVTLKPGPGWFATDRIAENLPRAWFARAELLAIARAVPSGRGALDSHRLDTGATTLATMRAGGLPTLRFSKRKMPLPVIVLGDRDSGARGWSELPQALRDALERAGVDADLGWFDGRLERFDLSDGTSCDVAGLLRRPELLLLVSDGLRLDDGARLRRLLAQLGRSGRVAWIDEREPRFWHAFDPQFGVAGLPVWPGTTAGIVSALRALSGERLVRLEQPIRRSLGGRLAPAAEIGRVLDDAAGWAAACAMVQPLSVPLAQHLRCRFFPDLPALALGRLIALPGSRLTQEGLWLDLPVLARLRSDFALRFDPARQDDILAAIRTAIEASDPGWPDSPAQDAYAWYRARFLLEAEPDDAIPELLQLKSSALGPAIARDLQRTRLPQALGPVGAVCVPLLRRPSNPRQLIAVANAFDATLAGEAVRLWSLQPRTDEVTLPARGVAAAAAAARICVLLDDGRLALGGTEVIDLDPPESKGSVPPDRAPLLALSADGRTAAIANRAGADLAVFALTADPPDRATTRGSWVADREDTPIGSLSWSPSQSWLVAGHASGLLVFDLDRARERGPAKAIDVRPGWGARAVAFSKDGRFIVVGRDSRVFLLTASELFGTAGDAGGKTAGAAQRLPAVDNAAGIETGLAEVEAVAAGIDGWPIAAAGGGLAVVLHKDGSRSGPWGLPRGAVAAIETLDDGRAIAALSDDHLVVLHARTGVNLLQEDEEEQRHATLAVDVGRALLWRRDRRSVTVHAFADDPAAAPASQAA